MNAARSSDGWTPLFVAAMLGRLEVVLVLLQSGADPALLDTSGRSAAALASQYSHHAVADTLVSPRDRYRPQANHSNIAEDRKPCPFSGIFAKK